MPSVTTPTAHNRTAPASHPPLPLSTLPRLPPLAARRLDRGVHEIGVYVLGSIGIGAVAKLMGVSVYKIGAMGASDPRARVADCRRQRYASLWVDPHDRTGSQVPVKRAEEWILNLLPEPDASGQLPDGTKIVLPDNVVLRDGRVIVTVPSQVSVRDYDLALDDALKARRFNAFLGTRDGQARMRAAGFDPKLRLATAYDLIGETPRISLANELYVIRPNREVQDLVRLCGVLGERLAAQEAARQAA